MLFIGIINIVKGRKLRHLCKIIKKTPTSKIGALRPGRYVEVKGKAKCSTPVLSPEGNRQCVWYSNKISEPRHDSSGHIHYRVISDFERHVPFAIQDDTGTINVDSRGAEFDVSVIVERELQEGEKYAFGTARRLWHGLRNVPGYFNQRRLEIRGIEPDDTLYILGKVRLAPDRRSLIIRRDKEMFFISNRECNEDELIQYLRKKLFDKYGGKVALIMGCSMLLIAFLLFQI